MSAGVELLQFLSSDADVKTRLPAVLYVLGMTATNEGLDYLDANRMLVTATASLVHDSCPEVVSKCYECLVNITSRSSLSNFLLEQTGSKKLLQNVVESVLVKAGRDVHKCAAILSNLTQTRQNSEMVWAVLMELDNASKLLDTFVSADCKSNCDHLGFAFSNLTQLAEVRRWFLDPVANRIQKLFPFLTLETSAIRKHGAAGALKNCCFETESNEWLLGPDVDILPRLLFPLMGPEELDEDEMEKLPLDLQYLGSDKQREGNPEIRIMIIEALTQLCATKSCREKLRDSGTYYVMRELHKVETCRPVLVACENLVDILISDEPGPGMENLKEVEVPQDLVEKFDKYNEALLKE